MHKVLGKRLSRRFQIKCYQREHTKISIRLNFYSWINGHRLSKNLALTLVCVIFFIAILRKFFVNVKTFGKINIGQKTNKDDSRGNGAAEYTSNTCIWFSIGNSMVTKMLDCDCCSQFLLSLDQSEKLITLFALWKQKFILITKFCAVVWDYLH